MKKAKLGVLIIAMTGAMLAFTGCGAKKVNLNDYMTISFSGYDGYGTASAHLENEKLEEALGDLDDDEMNGMGAIAVEMIIDGSFDVSENLSNGDKVTYKWNISDSDAKTIKEKLNVKLKYSDESFTVKDLKDPSEFDPAEILTINVNGFEPAGTISVSAGTGFTATVDKADKLSNGDEVVITIKPSDSSKTMEEVCAKNHIPTFDGTYKYKVEGLASYVTQYSEIPEETEKYMRSKAEEALKNFREEDDCEDDWLPQFTNHKNFDSYKLVAVAVDPIDADAITNSAIYKSNSVIYIYETKYSKHSDVTTYNYVRFNSVIDSAEGIEKLEKDTTSGKVGDVVSEHDGYSYFGDSSIEDLLEYIAGKNGDASRYNVETIDGEAPTASSGDSDKAAEKEDAEKEDAEQEETADESQTLSGWYGLTESSWEEYGNDLYLNFTDNNSGSVRDGDLGGEFKKTGNEYSYATEFGTFTFTIDINNDGTLTYHCADGTFTLEKCSKPN